LFLLEPQLYSRRRGLTRNKNRPSAATHAELERKRTAEGIFAEVVMSTTLDKFRGAALALARSGSIKDRLTDAYRNHLALVEENELPGDLVEEFRAVSRTLNRERPLLRGEDTFRATVRKMSNVEADEVASCVVRMFGAMCGEPSVTARVKGPKSASHVISLYPGEPRSTAERGR